MKKENPDKIWTVQEEFLRKNINVMQPVDIAKELGRTENCVNIKIHRLRLPVKKGGRLKEMVSRNIVHEMLTQRIGTPETFRPTRDFLERTQIGQKRFWQLYRGEKNITPAEYLALTKEWNITLVDAFEMGQLKMEF